MVISIFHPPSGARALLAQKLAKSPQNLWRCLSRGFEYEPVNLMRQTITSGHSAGFVKESILAIHVCLIDLPMNQKYLIRLSFVCFTASSTFHFLVNSSFVFASSELGLTGSHCWIL
ncbi:hypothetical protein PoB_001313800 [Plakobranchus ocellatus]|uniref:Uncharacterized protein n=1 Tax=Plakobranchus ocellatus TaxID=259542 RepID=A0AAV3YWL9_9GAST|nr:hypothetical protein PoB_001313800 [Plakobranchus ocellatus]